MAGPPRQHGKREDDGQMANPAGIVLISFLLLIFACAASTAGMVSPTVFDDAIDLRVGGDERRRQADAIHHHARVEPAVEHRLGELLREAGFGRKLLPRGLVAKQSQPPPSGQGRGRCRRRPSTRGCAARAANDRPRRRRVRSDARCSRMSMLRQRDGATGGMSRVGKGMHPPLARRHAVDHFANRHPTRRCRRAARIRW